MVLLNRWKYIYISIVFISFLFLGVVFYFNLESPTFRSYKNNSFFSTLKRNSLHLESSTFLKPSSKPTVLILPARIEPSSFSLSSPTSFPLKEKDILGSFISQMWYTWGLQSPSLLFYQYKTNLNSYSNYNLLQIAKKENVDYIAYPELYWKDGVWEYRSILYSKQDNVKFQSQIRELPDYSLAESILLGLESIFSFINRNLNLQMGSNYPMDKGKFFSENFIPSSDTVHRYLELKISLSQGKKVYPEDWENLTKREPFFWLPWEEYLKHRFQGKEDSFEARYYLEQISRKLPNYYTLHLALVGLHFLKNFPPNAERYKWNSLLELTQDLFLKSENSLLPEYGEFLNLYGWYLTNEKRWQDAQAYLLNANYIFTTLKRTHTEEYRKNLFLLSKALRESKQIELSSHILEKLLEFTNPSYSSLFFTQSNGFFNQSNENVNFQKILFYNLGCLNLDLGKPNEASFYFKKLQEIIKKDRDYYSLLHIHSRVNYVASLFMGKKWNQALSFAKALQDDLWILGLKGSDWDSVNSYNIALIYLQKNAEYSSKEYYSYYERITPYNQRRSLNINSKPLYFNDIYDYPLNTKDSNRILSYYEEQVVRSFTGKYKMEEHPIDVRSRTYKDRLEDHEIFLKEFLGISPPSSPLMPKLKKLLSISSRHQSGKNIVFVDIGPGIAHPTEPAITSLSLIEKFPKMDLILIDLPSEVNIFLKITPPELKNQILKHENLRIVAGDGVESLKKHFLTKEAWVLPGREIPSYKNKVIIIRAANSIDVYEPYPRVANFLKSLVEDFYHERILLFFNRLILVKPSLSKRFFIVGSQSIRGFYHNEFSHDRKGQPPYLLSHFLLGED